MAAALAKRRQARGLTQAKQFFGGHGRDTELRCHSSCWPHHRLASPADPVSISDFQRGDAEIINGAVPDSVMAR